MARKFYRSSQFMLTMQQIKWLENHPNKSQIVRWLIERAMASEDFEENYVILDFIEKKIEKLERTQDKIQLEEWKQRRKNVLAKLI